MGRRKKLQIPSTSLAQARHKKLVKRLKHRR